MKASFSFPSYFGENLDAIDECMRDLSWMQEDTIRIKFKNYHKALEKNEGATHNLIKMFRSYEDFWGRRNSNHNKIKFILNKKLQ